MSAANAFTGTSDRLFLLPLREKVAERSEVG